VPLDGCHVIDVYGFWSTFVVGQFVLGCPIRDFHKFGSGIANCRVKNLYAHDFCFYQSMHARSHDVHESKCTVFNVPNYGERRKKSNMKVEYGTRRGNSAIKRGLGTKLSQLFPSMTIDKYTHNKQNIEFSYNFNISRNK
jgi:hypothetical protein